MFAKPCEGCQRRERAWQIKFERWKKPSVFKPKLRLSYLPDSLAGFHFILPLEHDFGRAARRSSHLNEDIAFDFQLCLCNLDN
jgi:hypothetical protein